VTVRKGVCELKKTWGGGLTPTQRFRGSKVCSGEEDPLNNGTAGTRLPVTAESAGAIRGSRFSA